MKGGNVDATIPCAAPLVAHCSVPCTPDFQALENDDGAALFPIRRSLCSGQRHLIASIDRGDSEMAVTELINSAAGVKRCYGTFGDVGQGRIDAEREHT